MTLRTPKLGDPVLEIARWSAGMAAKFHRATLEGAESIPDGPALLVGNHGLFGFETPIFFWLVQTATGRFPIGLADRFVFASAPMQAILSRIGGVLGTRDNARELLRCGELVVCYPGGVHEVFKSRAMRRRLRWSHTVGFAKVAIAAQIPVIPFAGLGVDDGWIHLGHPPLLQRLLGPYVAPFALGPLPRQYRFRLAAPMAPPAHESQAAAFKAEVQAAVEALLRDDVGIRDDREERSA